MYELARERISGRVLGVKRDGVEHVTAGGSGWREFLDWNAKQETPIDLSDKPPDPPTAKEIEAARKFSVALTLIKNVPESYETGTVQQQFMWACKHLFKRVAQEID